MIINMICTNMITTSMITTNMITTNMITTNMISTNLISTNSSILCKEEHHIHNDLLPQDGNFAPDGNF